MRHADRNVPLQVVHGQCEAYDAAQALEGRRVAVVFANGWLEPEKNSVAHCAPLIHLGVLVIRRWVSECSSVCERLAEVYLDAHRRHQKGNGHIELPFEVVLVRFLLFPVPPVTKDNSRLPAVGAPDQQRRNGGGL